MAGTIWIPGAERLHVSAVGGAITSTAPPRAVWHSTEADPGTDNAWNAMVGVLTGKGAEPQVLYDPVTDRLGQFIALDLSGRALQNDGATKTNRVGRVCIQIEVIARAAKPFTAYWKPGPNFRALMAAIRSWGIPDEWPSGPPPRFVSVGTGGYNSPEDERSRTIWLSKGGHYGHSQIPANTHGDPGGISVAALFAAGGKPSPGTPGPTPTPPKDDDVALTKQQETDIAQAGWLARQFAQTAQFETDLDGIDNIESALPGLATKAELEGVMGQLTSLTQAVNLLASKLPKAP